MDIECSYDVVVVRVEDFMMTHPKRAEHVGVHSVVDSCEAGFIAVTAMASSRASSSCIRCECTSCRHKRHLLSPVSSAPPINGADTPLYSPRACRHGRMSSDVSITPASL